MINHEKIILCSNRKAYFEYEILDKIEAGIVLQGCEVKSIHQRKMSLDGSYALIEKNELWLINSHIDEQKHIDAWNAHECKRRRKLLLKRSEIRRFAEKSTQKGFTLVPLSVYSINNNVKIELAVCRGKQLHDRRQAEKDKEFKKEKHES